MGELVVLIVVGAAGLIGYLGVRRMRKALSVPIADSTCVACGSREVIETAPQCYACSACGYEGGAGQEQARATAFARRVASMSPTERFDAGLRALEDARGNLVSAVGTFNNALSDSRLDLLGSANASEDKYNTISTAFSEVMHAQDSIRKAAVYLDDHMLTQLGLQGPEMDFSSALYGVEQHHDMAVVDIALHGRIRTAKANTEHMRGAVERALDKLHESGTYRG